MRKTIIILLTALMVIFITSGNAATYNSTCINGIKAADFNLDVWKRQVNAGNMEEASVLEQRIIITLRDVAIPNCKKAGRKKDLKWAQHNYDMLTGKK
jgi:hypothetical protein